MKMRPIDADALDARIYNDIPIRVFGSVAKMANMREIVSQAPTIDAESARQWISVKDRLPESGVHVLVCCDIHPLNPSGVRLKRYICDGYYAAEHSIADGCRDSDFYDAYDYDEEEDEYYLKEGWYEVIKNWDEYSSVVIEDFVTYWMPLPELPKEDDNGTD